MNKNNNNYVQPASQENGDEKGTDDAMNKDSRTINIGNNNEQEIPLGKEIQDAFQWLNAFPKILRLSYGLSKAFHIFMLYSMILSPLYGVLICITHGVAMVFVYVHSYDLDMSNTQVRETLHFTEKVFVPKWNTIWQVNYARTCALAFPIGIKDTIRYMFTRCIDGAPVLIQLYYFNFEPYGSITHILVFIYLGLLIIREIHDKPLHRCLRDGFFLSCHIYYNVKIKNYFKTIHECLVTLNMENEVEKRQALTKLQTEHEKNEKWAFEVNKRMSPLNGVLMIDMIGLLVLFLSAIPIVAAEQGQNPWQKTMVLAYVLYIFCMNIWMLKVFVLGPATANIVWLKESRTTLSDPLIQLKLEQLLGVNYPRWLSNHELSAQRVFGIKYTKPLATRIVTSLYSGLIGAILYILNQSINIDQVMKSMY